MKIKKNILLLNSMKYEHYFSGGNHIIDYSKYNVFIITSKRRANEIPSGDYTELYAMDINNDEDRAFEIAKQINGRNKIDYVIALSERNILLSGRIRDHLGIEGLGYEQALYFRDKYVMKSVLKNYGILVPEFNSIESVEDIEDFHEKFGKCIVKPKNGMGSQNTYIIDSKKSITYLSGLIKDIISDYEIEKFIDGDFYHCDSIVERGDIKLCNIMQYSNSLIEYGESKFISGIMEEDNDLNIKIHLFNKSVIEALGLKYGVTHHEFFIDVNKNIVFCEIAARPAGGDIVEAIKPAYSMNLYEASILLELKEKLPEIKNTGLKSGWLLIFPCKGVITKMSDPNTFKLDWIPYFKFYFKEGDVCAPPKLSADCLASFVVIGKDGAELSKRIEWIKKEFRVIYKNE